MTSLNKWGIGKMIFAVSREDFTDALDIMDKQIEKETGQKPGLKITFYKVAQKLHEDPALNIPELLGEITSRNIPFILWRKANLVQATFNTAATANNPALKATVRKGPDAREMTFHVEPEKIGDRIGRHMLNENGRFAFWSRGIRY